MNVLVVDVGGTHIKVLASGQKEPRKFDSGPDLVPGSMVLEVRKIVSDRSYDVVSIGYPGPATTPSKHLHNDTKGAPIWKQ
jgi:polyphosphate glucokinase